MTPQLRIAARTWIEQNHPNTPIASKDKMMEAFAAGADHGLTQAQEIIKALNSDLAAATLARAAGAH